MTPEKKNDIVEESRTFPINDGGNPVTSRNIAVATVALCCVVAAPACSFTNFTESKSASEGFSLADLPPFSPNPASTYIVKIEAVRLAPPAANPRDVRPWDAVFGGGFFVNKRGLILTNHHVIRGAHKISVAWNNYRYDAVLIGTDPASDLAVIAIQTAPGQAANSFPEAPLGDSDALELTQVVRALGYPGNLSKEKPAITTGTIAHLAIELPSFSFYTRFIMTDAQLLEGSSGGFFIDNNGDVVGMSSVAIGGSSLGFFIPINHIKALLPQLEHGDVLRGSIGIAVQSLRETRLTLSLQHYLALEYQIPMPPASIPNGVIVMHTIPDRPAATAGIVSSDIITHVNGTPVDTIVEFHSLIGSRPPGTSFELLVSRPQTGGAPRLTTITVVSSLP